MSIQKRIWQSRIRNLPEDISSISSGGSIVGGSSKAFSGGMASLSADSTNPITPGMKPGGKTPGGKTPGGKTPRWDAKKGEYKDVEQFSWADKAVVDGINSSREAITNLQTKLGGLTKNLDVTTVVAKKLGSDISTLISSVGSEKAMNILRNEFGGNQPDTAGSELPPEYTIDPDDIPDNVPGLQPSGPPTVDPLDPLGPMIPGAPGPLTPIYVTKPLPVDPNKPFTPSNPAFPEGPGTLDPDLFGPDVLDPRERDPAAWDTEAPILVTPYGPGGVIITIPGVGVFVVNPDGKGGKWYPMA